MKNIFARGGIEFLAVFLGIALSLWVDDYREERELKNRLEDDFQKIYKEVQSNIKNIDNIIKKNRNHLKSESKLLDIINQKEKYSFDKSIDLIDGLKWPTFFGETTAYRTSIASGRFNTSDRDTLVRSISLLYEHYFVRLTLNGDILDQRAFDFLTKYAVKFNKPRFNQQNIDTLKLEKYFFSDEFHNGLLSTHDIRKNYYMHRLNETKNHLNRVQKIFDSSR
jgi:hypothetical protein